MAEDQEILRGNAPPRTETKSRLKCLEFKKFHFKMMVTSLLKKILEIQRAPLELLLPSVKKIARKAGLA